MREYLPVFSGDISGLRQGLEGLLTDNSEALMARLQEAEDEVNVHGIFPTFATELEYMTVADPGRPANMPRPTEDQFYEDVIAEVNGAVDSPPQQKGKIIWVPSMHPAPLMVAEQTKKGYNPQQAGISELRTAPADTVCESLSRSWQAIQGLGTVAARHNEIVMLLGVQLNAVIRLTAGGRADLLHLDNLRRAAAPLAAMQAAMHALRPLQVDAGLERGIVVDEAFPATKDAMTTLHGVRLERRYATVGLHDLQIDALGILAGLQQWATGTIPKRVTDTVRACSQLEFGEGNNLATLAFEALTVWDERAHRLVLPGQLEAGARSRDMATFLDEFVTELTDGAVTDYLADNGAVVRTAARAVRLENGKVRINSRNPYAPYLGVMLGGTSCHLSPALRVPPEVTLYTPDVPELHLEERRRLLGSRFARYVFGDALPHLVSAEESVARRTALIADHMVVPDVD